MILFPATLKQANTLIAELHRHHKPIVGHRYSIGCKDEQGNIIGIAVVGRPVAREVEQYEIAEITRLVTNGHKNACSFLYSACARAAQAMGYKRIQTAILITESGISLKASGFRFDHIIKGRDWNCPSRGGRRTDQPMCDKQLWIRDL